MSYPVKICTCCLFAAAYGEPCTCCELDEQGEEHPAGLLGKLEPNEYIIPGDDEEDFSRTPCAACGQTLHGTRHTATIEEM